MKPPKKFLTFQEATFRAREIKKNHSEKLLIFHKIELYSRKLKKNSCISRRTLYIYIYIYIYILKFFIFSSSSLKTNLFIFDHNIFNQKLHSRNY